MKYVLAVDIGATKAALAIVDEKFIVHDKVEVPTGKSPDIWPEIERHSRSLVDSCTGDFCGVGIASAGPLDIGAETISPVNISTWRDFPIVGKFRELFGDIPVVLHGDAMALANAEHQLGAGRGAANILGMVVSTGVGGGLVIANQLVIGDSGNASLIGHHSIAFQGEQCACGRRGCVEAYASGPKMVARAQASGWQSSDNSFIALAESARNGDPLALAAIDFGAHAMAVGLVNVCTINDITVVVVGGGVAEAGEIYWSRLRHHVAAEVAHIAFLQKIELRPAQLLRDAGLMGAALAVISPQ
jgi:glucokinase